MCCVYLESNCKQHLQNTWFHLMCLFVEDSPIVVWIKINVDGTMLFENEVHGEPKNDEKYVINININNIFNHVNMPLNFGIIQDLIVILNA